MKQILIIFMILFVTFNIPIMVHAESDQETYQQIDKYLKSELNKAHIPGMAITVVNNEEVLFSNTYGNCNSLDTPFIIGSMSKSFTAAAIMQLVEQGEINLDDHVSKYLPEVSVGERITVRQLLNQTSGLATYQTRNNLKITDAYGTHMYANVNYNLLGEIIAAVSGISYEEYIKENIYVPLGMKNSYTSLEEGRDNDLITGYRNYFGFSIPQEVTFPDGQGWTSVSGGYLISSASDMGKYLQMYLNNGDGIISAGSINTVFYDNVYDAPSSSYYGMGWNLNNNNKEPVLGHSGLVENYMSYMFILPQSDIGVVMLVNTNDYFVSNNMMSTIGESIISIFMGEEPIELSGMNYVISHLLIDIAYLVVFLVSILPLVFIKRWFSKAKRKKKSNVMLTGSILHLVFPTLLLLLPAFIGVPFFVVRGFVPDLFITLIVSALLSYAVGIVKIILIWKSHII